MPRILHFADAHIDIANYGRHDPESGLPVRVVDFLKSLDTIIDAALKEQVELVIFAGDAFKDRSPAPTFQREWGQRIMRLSRAGIPTLLLVGNHDLSPSLGRAHALENFNTLEVPHVIVADKPEFFGPEQLGVDVQVIALPWVARSGMMAYLDIQLSDPSEVYAQLEEKINNMIDGWLAQADPDLPTILTAHASVQGAVYGGERTVMIGGDLVLSGGLVKDPRLDYVALGHIHKAQDLNEEAHPPVVYPGSIERVDWGEAKDPKYYVTADVQKGKTEVTWHELKHIRRFIDRHVNLESEKKVMEQIRKVLPAPDELQEAIVRLTLDYPRAWESLIDEAALHEMMLGAFEFHLVKRAQMETRIRLPEGQAVGSMSPADLLDTYWKSTHDNEDEREDLLKLAQQIIAQTGRQEE